MANAIVSKAPLPAAVEPNSSPPYPGFLSSVEIRVAGIALALAIIARFQAFLPGYSIDDYAFVNQGVPAWLGPDAIAGGRWGAHLLFAAVARLGVAPPRAAPVTVLLLTVALIAVGIALCRLWKLSDRFGPSLITVCLVSLHPYQAEMHTFRTAAVILAASLSLGFAALLNCTRSRLHWIVSVFLFVLSLSIYQLVLNYIALALVFAGVFNLASAGSFRGEWFRRFVMQVAMILAAVLLYTGSVRLVSTATGVSMNARTTFLSVDKIDDRAMIAIAGLRRMATFEEPIVPQATKAILLLTFFTGCISLIVRIVRKEVQKGGTIIAALLLGVIVGAPFCYGLILLLEEWWPVPRQISAIAVYLAGLMVFTYTFAGVRVQRVLAWPLAVVVFSFIGINGQIFADQLRVNARDSAMANRILGRLESLPEFRRVNSIVLYGGTWNYASPIPTVTGDMNVSGLFAQQGKVALLNEFSGYAFATAPFLQPEAKAFCGTAPKWPAAESMTVIGSTAVVCLPE